MSQITQAANINTDQSAASSIVLRVQDLVTEFQTEKSKVRVLDGVSFALKRGQTLGIVGESGCGKSVTAMSIMGLLPRPYGQIKAGHIHYYPSEQAQVSLAEQKMDLLNHDAGIALTELKLKQLHAIRGARISMIFQDPMTALNPVKTIGKQLEEVYRLHRKDLNTQQKRKAALEMLDKVGIPSAFQRLDEYPHQLSGGMRQRVMIAMALACEPDILICDEPTTALDVTVQAQILDLMQDLQDEQGMSIIFITHDLGVIAQLCDDVVVMYAGQVVEQSDVFELFDHPKHPYTQGLLQAIPHDKQDPKTPLVTIAGHVPSLEQMPSGCRFSNRCPYVQDKCYQEKPKVEQAATEHSVRCHFWSELAVSTASNQPA